MDEEELIKRAMSVMGSRKTERKTASSRANITAVNERNQLHGFPEATREKLRQAQQARRQREREAKSLSGNGDDGAVKEKRPPGRPRTRSAEQTPKRGRGRPRKQAEETPE